MTGFSGLVDPVEPVCPRSGRIVKRLRYIFHVSLDAFYTFLADDGWAIASHIALSTLMALFPFLIVLRKDAIGATYHCPTRSAIARDGLQPERNDLAFSSIISEASAGPRTDPSCPGQGEM